jgi:hypothetical protein
LDHEGDASRQNGGTAQLKKVVKNADINKTKHL